ncbi:hypothetical protein NSA05_03015 [Ligilactobacillus apodemi]|nr:hypothetical protein [Ligilactobacillus apodemi]MCR1900911.1 hypothetical protein [Ligilactobacillus apodemi]
MKKGFSLGVTTLAFVLLLSGCSTNSNNSKTSSSSKAKSERLAKESSKRKAESKRKASESKKKTESERKASEASAKAESESKANEAQSSSEQSVASNQQQVQSQSNEQSQTQVQQPSPAQPQQKTQGQINMERGYDPKGNPVIPGQDHAPGTDVHGNSDSWVQGQVEWAKQNGYLNQDGTPTEKGQQANSEVEANANSDDTGDPNGAY